MQRQLLLPTRMPDGGLHRHKTAPAEHCAVQIVNGICRLDKQNLLRTMRENQIGSTDAQLCERFEAQSMHAAHSAKREITVPWREDGGRIEIRAPHAHQQAFLIITHRN
jgi:hypothetical protein